MSIIETGKIYYHTSYMRIEKVDLSLTKPGSDFGRGFYLTSSKEQAERFVNAAIRKSRQSLECGYVISYRLKETAGLALFEFETTNAEWLHCVCAFRSGFGKAASIWEGYDIIAGKVANDDTNATIMFYLAGAYGEVGSDGAVAAALGWLRPNVLEDQICLKTQHAVERLEYVDALSDPETSLWTESTVDLAEMIETELRGETIDPSRYFK
ncbi:MAG: DUF3990 domain-containing protein [Clostridiales Family XIII bacterium]|jgi:hypothetical protein|nr:DUF3990 domain-containing protein [Clostridiales Family XIII bacterium]